MIETQPVTKNMRIAQASDLHLEFGDIDLKNEQNADVLILGGDIMVAQDLHDHPDPVAGVELGRRQESAQRYRDFLRRVSKEFPHVIYIAGNHEFYHGKFVAGITYLRDECAQYPNVYFMENDTQVIDDVVFVGATLWTDMNRGNPLTLHTVTSMMNDFKIIRHDGHGYTRLRPAHVADRHRKSLEYIRTVIDHNQEKTCVVVSHMAPSFASISDEYVNDSLMNGAYASDLSEFILDRPQIKLWTHGHTHHNSDYLIGSTRVLCNPRGYIGYESQADSFELVHVDI